MIRTLFPVVAICLLSLVAGIPSNAQEPERVSVELKSGRTFSGYVDARSDSERLWLRYGTASLTVLRPIDWGRITTARHNDEAIPTEELKSAVLLLRSAATPPPALGGEGSVPSADRSGATFADRAQRLLGSPPVRTVRFNARLENWDADAEPDGLIIHVFPLTNDGQIARVNATVEARLTAFTSRSTRGARNSRVQTPLQVGRWSEYVGAAEVDPIGGATIQLPFTTVHPERDPRVGSHGLIEIRVVIPGHGVFHDAVDAVRIRRYSPTLEEQGYRATHRP